MTQEKIVLRMLRERGREGVSNHEFVYRHGITRAAAIVHRLRTEDGFDIETKDEGNGKLCRYIMKGWPDSFAPAPPPKAEDLTPLPPPAELPLPCGCVRSVDGRSWVSRCMIHEGRGLSAASEGVGW